MDRHEGIRSFKQNQYIMEYVQKKSQDKFQTENNTGGPQVQRCVIHDMEQTKICSSQGCKLAICSKCEDRHEGHNIIGIAEQYDVYRKSLNDVIQLIVKAKTILVASKKEIDKHSAQNILEIHSAWKTVVDKVNKLMEEKLANAKTQTSKLQELIAVMSTEMDEKIKLLKSMQVTSSSNFSGSFDFEFLDSMKIHTLSNLSTIGRYQVLSCVNGDVMNREIAQMCANILSVQQPLESLNIFNGNKLEKEKMALLAQLLSKKYSRPHGLHYAKRSLMS